MNTKKDFILLYQNISKKKKDLFLQLSFDFHAKNALTTIKISDNIIVINYKNIYLCYINEI